VTAPAQNLGRSHDFVTLAAVICQQLKSDQGFFLQEVFIVEYHLTSNSDLSCMNEFKDAFFDSFVPYKSALSHLMNRFSDSGSV
jgi:hypothetical protein